MLRGYTVKLYPNQAQSALLDRHFGCTRWVYNHMIAINQKAYHRRGENMSGYDMQAMLPKLKKQYPWLTEVNSQSLQIVCHNLAEAYNRFFKKQSGYPSFKKRGYSGSFTAINDCKLLERHIRLPKLGMIRYRGGDKPEGKIKRFTVKADTGAYYASILFDDGKEEPSPCLPATILGIDLGITDVIVTSEGETFKASKFLKSKRVKLKQAQQSLSRRQKGSKRRARAKLAVAKLHQKIRNQRKDFNHKLTRKLADGESQAFAVESLNVKGMMANHKLAGHIADCGWHQLKTFLSYKAAAVGKQVLEVDRWFPSSKTCSACGIVRQSLPLSVREWTCGDCGSVHHRDVNAAINIAREAARNSVFDRGGSVSPVVRLAAANETKRTAVW